MILEEPPPSRPFGRDETWITLAEALARAAAEFLDPSATRAEAPAQSHEQE